MTLCPSSCQIWLTPYFSRFKQKSKEGRSSLLPSEAAGEEERGERHRSETGCGRTALRHDVTATIRSTSLQAADRRDHSERPISSVLIFRPIASIAGSTAKKLRLPFDRQSDQPYRDCRIHRCASSTTIAIRRTTSLKFPLQESPSFN